MNNLYRNSYSNSTTSVSKIIFAGLLATSHPLTPIDLAYLNKHDLPTKSIFIGEASPTHTPSLTGFATITFLDKFREEAAERKIKEFYDNLTRNQTSLGEDFDAILQKNLWTLYES